uniref:Uncharacterized protein n=1 Tax=Oryza punctata TaxID=4537 RepID=A0A0E0LPB4_ORYPU
MEHEEEHGWWNPSTSRLNFAIKFWEEKWMTCGCEHPRFAADSGKKNWIAQVAQHAFALSQDNANELLPIALLGEALWPWMI